MTPTSNLGKLDFYGRKQSRQSSLDMEMPYTSQQQL